MTRPECIFSSTLRGTSCLRGCGVQLDRDYATPPRRHCPGPLSLRSKAANYARAVAGWARAWFRTRGRRERRRILAICQGCEYYRPGGRIVPAHCGKCGCRVSASGNALANKIAMSTEHCPLDPPKW